MTPKQWKMKFRKNGVPTPIIEITVSDADVVRHLMRTRPASWFVQMMILRFEERELHLFAGIVDAAGWGDPRADDKKMLVDPEWDRYCDDDLWGPQAYVVAPEVYAVRVWGKRQLRALLLWMIRTNQFQLGDGSSMGKWITDTAGEVLGPDYQFLGFQPL